MELTLNVNDKSKLYSKTFISMYHHQVVHLLYQPIIGPDACCLYFTLWDFINMEKGELIVSHKQLLTFFSWDIKKFLAVRGKLESIGLINTYYHPLEGYYIYELKQPLNAKQFFCDSHLNIHLLYLVGDNMYDYLEKKFVCKPLDKAFMNISKSFEDTFQLIEDVRGMESDTEYLSNSVNHFSVPIHYDFDFELLTILLNKSFISKDFMTPKVKEQIIQEAALYHFDAQMMSSIILECVKDNKVDLDLLHEKCKHNYKQLKTSHSMIDLKPTMTEKQFYETMNKKQLTNKEKALKFYKTKTPQEWLRELQNDTEVPASFLEVVNQLYTEYKLPSEVINVLIEFVRIRNDGRLPLEYAKTVASSWVFKKITTAEEAMEEVEKIKGREKEYVKRGEVAPTYTRKAGRVVDTPAWMKEETSAAKVDEETNQVDVVELKQLLDSFK